MPGHRRALSRDAVTRWRHLADGQKTKRCPPERTITFTACSPLQDVRIARERSSHALWAVVPAGAPAQVRRDKNIRLSDS
ncbi:hypothetical protein EVAR_56818_1 [Eumeta japonica]|uniref:Uncharacterized protein n=1 Tax=Eumeta variegata TaxID=151549 RepID=A0A4C1Y2S0_EUMVA|nr:hypothetical protein EVAR_56818_1 [Eumeta japonica]